MRILQLRMYISKLHIQNFRNCKNTTVEFQPGINVIIGENNGGKTTTLQALSMIFNQGGRRRPQFYDFCSRIEPSAEPPAITITATITSCDDLPEDMAMVATWLTRIEDPWEAELTYHFALPEEDHARFKSDTGENPDRNTFYKAIERSLPRYVGRIYAGHFESRHPVDSSDLIGFDFQFLKALRDAESELFTGADPLLKRMLASVLDDGIDQAEQINRRDTFIKLATPLMKHLRERLNYKELLTLVEDTGASDGGKVILRNSDILERDLIPSFRLHVSGETDESVEDAGVPLTHNGLGYNNLIYVSLTLREMRLKRERTIHGQNTSIFPMLIIEEPEAHLHPALQYRFLKSLKKQLEEKTECRQIFLTTHSAHITAACRLDEIICLNMLADGTQSVAYPGRVFGDTQDDQHSKRYLERFLDATKSSMLFARGIILVEGTAEQLVVPRFAERLDSPLEEHHVALIAVDGVTFKHFLKLFGAGAEAQRPYALHRPVACIVDADPQRKSLAPNSRWKACHVPLLDRKPTEYEYQPTSGVVRTLQDMVSTCAHIVICSGQKTFEYDVAFRNYNNINFLSADESRYEELREFCGDAVAKKAGVVALLSDDELQEYFTQSSEDSDLAALFATAYLQIASDRLGKGESATLLAEVCSDRSVPILIPEHIQEAIFHACRKASATS